MEILFETENRVYSMLDVRLDVRKYSFSQRTINVWNKLSTASVYASHVNNYVQGQNKQISHKSRLHLE